MAAVPLLLLERRWGFCIDQFLSLTGNLPRNRRDPRMRVMHLIYFIFILFYFHLHLIYCNDTV